MKLDEMDSANTLTTEQLMLRFDYFVAFMVGFDHDRFVKIDRQKGRHVLDQLMNQLMPHEQTVIALRFGFLTGALHDLGECARKMGIPRSEVKEHFEIALQKLQVKFPELINS